MKITRENYEAYLLDSYEGNLSSEEKKSLDLFLTNNPGLHEESASGYMPKLEIPEVKLRNKENLKKKEDEFTDLENLIIAKVEEIASVKENQLLKIKIKNSLEVENELAWYKKTKLKPEPIRFTQKESLKKKDTRIVAFWKYAATLLLFVSLAFMWYNRSKDKLPEIVEEKHMLLEKNKDGNTPIIQNENEKIPELIVPLEPIEKQKIDDLAKRYDNPVKRNTVLEEKDSIIKKNEIIPLLREENLEVVVHHEYPDTAMKETLIELDEKKVLLALNEGNKETVQANEGSAEKIPTLAVFIKEKVEKKVFNKEVDKKNSLVSYSFRVGKIGFSRKKSIPM